MESSAAAYARSILAQQVQSHWRFAIREQGGVFEEIRDRIREALIDVALQNLLNSFIDTPITPRNRYRIQAALEEFGLEAEFKDRDVTIGRSARSQHDF